MRSHQPVTSRTPTSDHHHAAEAHDEHLVAADDREGAEHPAVGERGGDERQAEAEREDRREQRPAAGGRLVDRQHVDRRQGRPDARRPADAEEEAEQGRRGQADGRHPVDAPVALEEAERRRGTRRRAGS